ncbi:MAG: glycoside hydrolase family 130 protein [Pirellulales bacterium]
MVQRLFQKLLIQPQDLAPSSDGLEVIGTFNPGVAEHAGQVVILARVAERQEERRAGYVALPRWENGQVIAEWIDEKDVECLDPRVVVRKSDNLLRLTFTSHLRVIRSQDGRTVTDWNAGHMYPSEPWEEYGIEDPRIVWLDDRFWITYVAVSRHGAATALASTSDFITFERHGIIFCPENKDVVLFPERIGGEYVALHRPTPAHRFSPPEMWLARSPDLLHWGSHRPLHGGTAAWESDRVGGGAPPIRTEHGWLEVYHASRRSTVAGQVGTYTAGAMLLDLDDPARVMATSREPLWEPEADYEQAGFVPRVIFPTGIVVRDQTVQLYYGASDTFVAMVELPIADLV